MNESLDLYVDILIGAGDSDRFEVGGNDPEMVERFLERWSARRLPELAPGQVFYFYEDGGMFGGSGVMELSEYQELASLLGWEAELLLAA